MSCRNPLKLQDKAMRALWLCTYCEKLFQPLEKPGCTICSAPVNPDVKICASCNGKKFAFIHNRSAFAYEDLVRDMLHEIKFRHKKHVAQGLGRLWAKSFLAPIPEGALLVPLPMHPAKKRQRGFDQAQVLARAISDATGIKLEYLLERTRDTPPQSGLHPRQRIENVDGAFRIKPEFTKRIAAQTIVIVDDIYTTGASLNECAKELKSAGTSDVFAITLAIALRKSGSGDESDALFSQM